MAAEQTAAELTTRDVLLQVDRRLTLIEEDLRGLDDKLDDKVDGLRSEVDRRLTLIEEDLRALDTKVDDVHAKLDAKIDTEIEALDAKLETIEIRLEDKIEGLRSEMYAQFGTLRSELGAKFDSHLKWTLGTMAVLIGLVIAVVKL